MKNLLAVCLSLVLVAQAHAICYQVTGQDCFVSYPNNIPGPNWTCTMQTIPSGTYYSPTCPVFPPTSTNAIACQPYPANAGKNGVSGTCANIQFQNLVESEAENVSGCTLVADSFCPSQPPPPPPPPPPACPLGTICGHVTAAEDGSDVVRQLVVLKDTTNGQVLGQPVTDSTGNYSFNVPNVHTFYAIPALNRMENAQPAFKAVKGGEKADFVLLGLPAHVTLHQTPGTFIMFSKAPYLAPMPPHVYAGMTDIYYSTVAQPDGSAKADLGAGYNYYVTCWIPQRSSVFIKKNSVQVSPTPLAPYGTYSTACHD